MSIRLLALIAMCAAAAPVALGAADSDLLTPGDHFAPFEGGVRLHYTVAGNGPLLIVCSPGWGIGARYLEAGLKPLEAHYKLLFVDTRGSGESSRPTDGRKMSGADMADDLERLRIFLELPTIWLLGHSDGGAIVLDYAQRHPTSVSKLVFVDGSTYDHSPKNKEVEARKDQLIKEASVDPRYQSAIAAMSHPITNDEQMDQYLKNTLPVYFADVGNVPKFVPTLEGTKPSFWALKHQEKANQSYPWWQEERLGDVQANTLIIVGKQDRICPPLIAENVHAGIRGSQLVEIDNSGHFPWIEQPDQFFAAVIQFLQ